MTTTQEDDIQPTYLIHWLYEDSLIFEVHQENQYGDEEVDLSNDCDLNRIVQEQVRSYQTTDTLGSMIERELDNLTTIICQKLPEERIREASWQLQAPGSYDPLAIPHHPTTETLLHRLLNQEGELKPGNGWIPESRARSSCPGHIQSNKRGCPGIQTRRTPARRDRPGDGIPVRTGTYFHETKRSWWNPGGKMTVMPLPNQIGPTQVNYRQARDILTKTSGFINAYDFTLNPYSGCSFGCSYCYAAFFTRDQAQQDNWGLWVNAKQNAAQLIEDLKPGELDGKRIYMSTVTDPYQPLDRRFGDDRRMSGSGPTARAAEPHRRVWSGARGGISELGHRRRSHRLQGGTTEAADVRTLPPHVGRPRLGSHHYRQQCRRAQPFCQRCQKVPGQGTEFRCGISAV